MQTANGKRLDFRDALRPVFKSMGLKGIVDGSLKQCNGNG